MAELVTKFCPECGLSFEGLDPKAHSLTHWPEFLDPAKSSNEARVRQKLTLSGGVTSAEYAKIHGRK